MFYSRKVRDDENMYKSQAKIKSVYNPLVVKNSFFVRTIYGVLDLDRLMLLLLDGLPLRLLDLRGGDLLFLMGGDRLALLERRLGGDRLREGDLVPERRLRRRGLRDLDRLLE